LCTYNFDLRESLTLSSSFIRFIITKLDNVDVSVLFYTILSHFKPSGIRQFVGQSSAMVGIQVFADLEPRAREGMLECVIKWINIRLETNLRKNNVKKLATPKLEMFTNVIYNYLIDHYAMEQVSSYLGLCTRLCTGKVSHARETTFKVKDNDKDDKYTILCLPCMRQYIDKTKKKSNCISYNYASSSHCGCPEAEDIFTPQVNTIDKPITLERISNGKVVIKQDILPKHVVVKDRPDCQIIITSTPKKVMIFSEQVFGDPQRKPDNGFTYFEVAPVDPGYQISMSIGVSPISFYAEKPPEKPSYNQDVTGGLGPPPLTPEPEKVEPSVPKRVINDRMLGDVIESMGYCSTDGKLRYRDATGKRDEVLIGPPYSAGQRIGCGVTSAGDVFFTHQGKYIGKSPLKVVSDIKYHAAVSFASRFTAIKFYTKPPFFFDPESLQDNVDKYIGGSYIWPKAFPEAISAFVDNFGEIKPNLRDVGEEMIKRGGFEKEKWEHIESALLGTEAPGCIKLKQDQAAKQQQPIEEEQSGFNWGENPPHKQQQNQEDDFWVNKANEKQLEPHVRPKRKAPPPKKKQIILVCVQEFKAEQGGDMSVEPGDMITLLEDYGNGWISGVNTTTGSQGDCPKDCCMDSEAASNGGISVKPPSLPSFSDFASK